MSATVKAIWVHWPCFLRAEPGFALPVSAQIKADSALPRAAGAALIALTEPAPAADERRLRGPTARRSPAPPLPSSRGSVSPLRAGAIFILDFKLLFK